MSVAIFWNSLYFQNGSKLKKLCHKNIFKQKNEKYNNEQTVQEDRVWEKKWKLKKF